MLTALAGVLAVLAVGTWAGSGAVDGVLRGRFGSAERDRAIEANPVLVEGTLMSADPLEGDPRWLVSYEYYVEVELFVGYARVPAEATLDWKRLEPLDVEVAADQPDLSRPAGVILAPSGWISDGWRRLSGWLALAQLVIGLGLGAVGLTRVRRSR